MTNMSIKIGNGYGYRAAALLFDEIDKFVNEEASTHVISALHFNGRTNDKETIRSLSN